jgi:hypothetical protein
MSAKKEPVEVVLGRMKEDMQRIVSGADDPYAAGWRIWGAALSQVGSDDDMHPLWLMWGALTDWVEMHPAETVQAQDAMRRAAQEWLSLPRDRQSRQAYFDRWLYDELGYERPGAKP